MSATKTPEEAYRIALSYERGNKYAKPYVTTAGTASSSTGGGGISIRSEPMGAIRGSYRSNQGNSSVGVIQGQANQERVKSEETDDEESHHENSMRLVNLTAEKRN